MAVVPSFLLLNLPSLPLNEVINYMCPVAQLWFSMVSKKTNDIMKTKQKFNLEVSIEDTCKILCKNQNGSEFLIIAINDLWKYSSEKNRFSRKIDNLIVPMKVENNILQTYFNDEINGYLKMTTLLCNAFKIQSFSISFSARENTDYAKIIEHVEEMKSGLKIDISKIEMACFTQHKNTRDANFFKNFMEKFKDVPELNIRLQYLVYRHNVVQPDMDNCYCFIPSAHWFIFENFELLMKCKKIEIWDSKWTSQEVNQFLKKWMDISTMENVKLFVNGVDLQIAVNQLPVTRHKKVVANDGRRPELKECFEIQRSDGVKANMWSERGTFIMQTYE